MGYQAPFPAVLEQVEYAKLYFHLEIKNYFDLPPLGLLQLRRELFQALTPLELHDRSAWMDLQRLLRPELSQDPILRGQIQKPSPAMVVSPDAVCHGLIEPGMRVVLPVLFVGSGVTAINSFIRLLQALGLLGLYHGAGEFELEGIEAEDASGLRAMLWQRGDPETELAPPISDLGWWLGRQQCGMETLSLKLISPLRLISRRRPLFKASFAELFPFVLRRVTGMLASHAGIETIRTPAALIRIAADVEVVDNRFYWQDWRALQIAGGEQQFGGLMGKLTLAGPALSELVWLLQLGSLFNVGKGAPYGAGQYQLDSC